MSIASSLYAEYANAQKDVWVAKLELAISQIQWTKDLVQIEKVIEEIKEFKFPE